jgi:tRNA-splicing ligase RtcB
MEDREALFSRVRERVPAGSGNNANIDAGLVFVSSCGDAMLDKKIKPFTHTQLGALGSGNHFLEIGVNGEGMVGVTIHSGSRRVGYEIASWYMRKGRLLSLESDLGRAYLADMNWALDFALENRRLMLKHTLEAMKLHQHQINKLTTPGVMINENHNHAVPFGDGFMLHRKGATPADRGQMGIIPANQRDGVWITVGLGNEEFLSSASHGAGRSLSRKDAAEIGAVSEL